MDFAQYLAAAPADEYFWWIAVPAIVALAAFCACFVFLRRGRLIEDMPTSRVRSAAQGYVELEGHARLMDGAPVLCPLTSTRCAWWRYRVEQRQTTYDSRGRRSTRWVIIDGRTSDDCFHLEDPTGRCIVDPDGAEVIPAIRHRWYGMGPRPDRGPGLGGGWFRALFCDYRYTEELIPVGAPVYALGAFRTQTGLPDRFDERADLRELLEKWKHDKAMMALLDVNKDGTVDMKEWDAAHRMAERKVRAEHVERANATPDLNILGRARNGRPYILSGVPQRSLVRRFRARAAAALSLSGMSGTFMLWALVQRGIIQ